MKSSSYFVLPFETASPVLDLSKLPAPFYLRDALIPETTMMVLSRRYVHDGRSPSTFNLAAGLGSLTGSGFALEVVTFDQLNDGILSANNLIFVGKPEHFELLSDIDFSLPVKNGQFIGLDASYGKDCVVIQLARSPWNSSKSILLVSGSSTVSC